jgi:hypothetical protein
VFREKGVAYPDSFWKTAPWDKSFHFTESDGIAHCDGNFDGLALLKKRHMKKIRIV